MSRSEKSNIAKNSIFLYLRMFIILGVGLFTSRIVLDALGIDDFGIYNVVGGVVATFTFLNMSLTNASSRFLSTSMGKGTIEDVNHTFCCILTIHYLLAIVIIILAETIGLWFMQTQLVIPPDRHIAAFWVYQSAVLILAINIISTPYNALIVSNERMGAFAYISIIESVGKLSIAYLLYFCRDNHRLIAYALLLVILQLTVRAIYTFYCHRNFKESSFKVTWDKYESKEILKFATWTLNGNIAVIGYTQGINILLNIFFGPAVNAARGVSVQVQSAVRQFYMSFQTALNPQIIKSYASGHIDYMHTLILSGSKLSFALILLIALPIYCNIDYILGVWLKEVPEYTSSFVRVILIICLLNTQANLLAYGVHATGNLKRYQIIEGGLLLMVVPVAYIGLRFFDISPTGVFIVYLLIETVTQVVRIFIVCPLITLRVSVYLRQAVFPSILVLIAASILPMLFMTVGVSGFEGLMASVAISLFSVSFSFLLFGINSSERKMIQSFFKNTRK